MSRNSPSTVQNARRMGMGVDWSELPQDIIESISKRLTIYTDYLGFRCVCRSWNSSLPKTPLHHLPPQLPWLMLSHNSFFDLSYNKLHRLNNLPPPSWPSRICGSSYGWLVILNETEVSLLNPITGSTISLPFLNTYIDLVAKLFHHSNNNLHLIKVVLSSNPSLSDDFVAFAILDRRDFVYCKKGYKSWVRLRVYENNHNTWIDVVYKNGSFFVMSCSGKIAVCNIEGSRVSLHENISFSNCFNIMSVCYTVLAGEDMLLVKQFNEVWSIVTGFQIFKMNWNVLKWEEIQTLGEYSLFIGKNSSLCFSAADFVGCRPNCIYFTNNLVRRYEFGFGIYNLSNHSIEPLRCYPRNLNFLLGYPIWATPNPC